MIKHVNKIILVTIKENNIVLRCPADTIKSVKSPPFMVINIDSAVIAKPNKVPQIPITTLIVSIPCIWATSNDGFFLFTLIQANAIKAAAIGNITERLLSIFWFFVIFNVLSQRHDKNLLSHYIDTHIQ